MAHATTNSRYDFSPERAVEEIRVQRKRNSLVALAVGLFTLVALGAGVYLSYRDVPAPDSPANTRPGLVEPYR